MNIGENKRPCPDIKKVFDEELADFWNTESAKIWDRWEEVGRDLVRKTAGHELLPSRPKKKEMAGKSKNRKRSLGSGFRGKRVAREKTG